MGAGYRAQHGRLPGPVRADERDRFSPVDREAHAAHGRKLPVARFELVYGEQASNSASAQVGLDHFRIGHDGSGLAVRDDAPRVHAHQVARPPASNMCTMCSIQTIATLRWLSSRMISTSSFASASVNPPPISSSSKTVGLVASARASSRRFRSMRPRVSARRLAIVVIPGS